MGKAKQKGTSWETAIVNYLGREGFMAKRRVLSGREDKGDIEFPNLPFLIIEAKNAKRYSFAEWVREANIEAIHADASIGVVWAHKQGKSHPGDGYVVMDGDTFTRLLQRLVVQ